MKNIIIRLFTLSLFATLIIGCNSDGLIRDLGVTPVQNLYEPIDGRVVELNANGSLNFEWEPALVEDSSKPLYEVFFDRENGDFSSPIATIASDNNGADNTATITHKQINRVAAEAGIESAEQGILKWTVYASKGYMPVKALEERTLTITRLAGFADIPDQVFISGEATEGGANIANALILRKLAEGEFEIYTKLTAGDTFFFTNNTSEDGAIYSIAGGLLEEEGTSTVGTEGAYRIILDFNTGSASINLIESIGFFFSPSNSVLFDLPYVGDGIFRAEGETVTFKQESWGRDERYKFRMFMREDVDEGDLIEMDWGTGPDNMTDSRPNPDSPDSYYHISLVNPSQWDNKWKLMADFDDVPADYTIYLQTDIPHYTHSVEQAAGQGGNGDGDVDEDDDIIRILAIGNSFSEDAIEQYLYELADAGGHEMIIANLYIGGSSLEQHANNAQNSASAYSYRKIVNGQKDSESDYTIERAIRNESWDYISFQQVSQLSGVADSYFPHLTYLIDYAKQFTTNPDVEFILHQTWAYSANSNHSGFPTYDNDQMTMYNAIVQAANEAADRANIDIIIPSGTAIQNGRTSIVGDTFDRDGYHLETTYGRFTAASTWYEMITGDDVVQNSYVPSSITPIRAEIAKNAASLAVANPNSVSSMANEWGEDITVDFTNPIYISFGSGSGSSDVTWNTMTSYETNSTIEYLADENDNYTNVSIEITDRFGGINGNGPSSTQTALNIPDWVSGSSFWGNGTGNFSGQTEPTGEFLISGLDETGEYEFSIFSSRSNVTDNRETRLTITGSDTVIGDVNSSSNTDDLVTFIISPDSNGEVRLKAEPGPNNNNGDEFFYINAMGISPM